MTSYSRGQAAVRAGAEVAFVGRLVEPGILTPEKQDRFSLGDVRRVLMATNSHERSRT